MATRVCSAVEYLWLVKGTATQQIDGKTGTICDAGWRSHKQGLGPPPAPGAHFSPAPRTRPVMVGLPHAQKQRAGLGQPPGQTPWGSGGGGYSCCGCSITVPRSFSRHQAHGKVLHGPHPDARGLGVRVSVHVQLGRPLLKSMVSNLLISSRGRWV